MFGVYERCLRDVRGVAESISCERSPNFSRDSNLNDHRAMHEPLLTWNVVGMICDLALICPTSLWTNPRMLNVSQILKHCLCSCRAYSDYFQGVISSHDTLHAYLEMKLLFPIHRNNFRECNSCGVDSIKVDSWKVFRVCMFLL